MPRSATATLERLWLGAMPGLFVVLWSTGFIGAKLGLPYAEPMTFLALRFAIVAALLLALCWIARAPWPASRMEVLHIAIAGLLLHGVYLGGVFASIFHGVQAGVSALIVGIQPLLTAAVAGRLLGERVSALQWLGLVLGLCGVALVVGEKLAAGLGTPFAMSLSVLALLGITAGTIYQKKFCGGMDLRSGNVIQFAAASLATFLLALAFETRAIVWSGEFIFAMAWLCLVLSLGAITLLYILIRRGAAARVSSLFYMVPPCTALVAYFLFDERLSYLALVGMGLAAVGVALVNVRR
ncbi:MAG: DMT family transporter [Alphaproteobacteria bacterium]|nr:DMT family transporter [Alphaproteobacteria bacterium]